MQVAFSCVIYPCLVLQYMGQAAFLSKNVSAVRMSFYASVPGKLLRMQKVTDVHLANTLVHNLVWLFITSFFILSLSC